MGMFSALLFSERQEYATHTHTERERQTDRQTDTERERERESFKRRVTLWRILRQTQ